MQQPVRTAFGQHPRLAILGPLEARLQRHDLTILGGLNEGAWPQSPGADPWFSRPMRSSLGLEQPERGIGLAAHDFAMQAAGPRVLLTRARRAFMRRAETLPFHEVLRADAGLDPCHFLGAGCLAGLGPQRLRVSLRLSGQGCSGVRFPTPRPPLVAPAWVEESMTLQTRFGHAV